MWRAAIFLASILCSTAAAACESDDRQTCMERFRTLVSYRAQAIEAAFGDVFAVLPETIRVRFVGARDPEHALLGGREAYDSSKQELLFPRRVAGSRMPNPLQWASYYWPYYQQARHQTDFPIIAAIDNVLWNAYLQEAAQARGLNWPHEQCTATQIAERLPCEMLIKGIAEHVKAVRTPLFNENRLEQIWPEDFASFERRAWRRTDPEYLNVQRYGGILLAQPLISQFGVLPTLAYMARTPFQIEQNNLRLSAARYQERARAALQAEADEPRALSLRRAAVDRDE